MRKLLLLTAVLLTVTAVILSAGCVQFHQDTDTGYGYNTDAHA